MVLILACQMRVLSQVIVRPDISAHSVSTLRDAMNLSVENTVPATYTIYLQITVENATEQVLSARSGALGLKPGLTVFTSGDLYSGLVVTCASGPAGKEFSSSKTFVPGSYKICYEIFSANDNVSLGAQCESFAIETGKIPEEKNGKKKPVAFHGTSELLFSHSTSQSLYTAMPPTYVSWMLNPQLTVYDIPVSGRLFVTTMQMPGQQNMNSFTLNFDANQYRNILKNKLLDFIKKQNALNRIGNLDFSSYAAEYDKIGSILSNPAVAGELAGLKELDSLKNIVNNPTQGIRGLQNITTIANEKYATGREQYENITSRVPGLSDTAATDSAGLQPLIPDKTAKIDSLQKTAESKIIHVKDSLFRIRDLATHKIDSVSGKVQTYIGDPSALGGQALDSLKKRIAALEWLESKRAYYEQLLEKKKKIEEYGKKFGMVDSAGNFTSFDKVKDIDVSRLSDPNYLYQKLSSSKLLRKLDKILYSLKSLSVGMSAPDYSTFTLSGMAVNGFSMEVEPFGFYGAFTYGTILNPVLTTSTQHASYRRDLIAGSFGYGSKGKTHLHFTMLSATDDSLSIDPRDSLYLYYKLPQDNKVMSLDGQINLFRNRLIVSAEISGSQTIKDLTTYSPNVIYNGGTTADPQNWFVNILTQNRHVNKAVVDFAIFAKAEAKLFKDRTTLSASFRRVGPNYYSFGLPFLIRDVMSFEVKVSQNLWKNRLRLSAYVKRNSDNLEENKLQTTTTYNYGFDVNLRIPKWPSFRASLMPLTLQSDTATFDMVALNISSSYNFNIRKFQNIASASFLKQASTATDTNLFFDITYVNLLYSIGWKNGPVINASSGYISSITNMSRKETWIAGIGGSMLLFKIWNNTLGANCYISGQETRWGMYWQTGADLLKYFTLSLRLENNQFNTYINLPGMTDYTQFNCRTSITARW